MLKKFGSVIFLLALTYVLQHYGLLDNADNSTPSNAPAPTNSTSSTSSPAPTTASTGSSADLDAIYDAYRQQRSNVQVQGTGVVSRVLGDDDDGSRHQRFILELDSGMTMLVAHNIDLAPRVADIHAGDSVSFNGEYEWNQQGGVLHWTHHDPAGRHVAGWLKHKGKTYQ